MEVRPTDAFGAALALAGLLVAVRRLDGSDALSRAFRGALLLVGAFLVARVGFWLTGAGALRALNLACAALIPLAALVLAETLVRRHAPLWTKGAVAGGALALAVAGLVPQPVHAPALLAFQVGAFLLVAVLVLGRDRASLSAGENALIDRAALAIPLILPFLLTDHLGAGSESGPLRLSGLAVLLTAWIGLGLRRPGVRARDAALAVAATLALSAATAWVLARQLLLDPTDALRLWGAVAAAMILAALLREDAEARRAERRRAVLPAPGTTDAARYLRDLRARGVLDDVVLLDGEALADFDAEAVGALLDAGSPGRSLAESQLRLLLERHEAAEAHLLSRAPLRLALVRAPGPTGADTDLRMAFALARALGAERAA